MRGLLRMNYFSTPISQMSCLLEHRLNCAQQKASPARIVVAGASLHPTDELKSLGVVIDSRLTFAAHALVVRKARNYHIWALQYIRHLLTLDVAKTLACSIVGSRLDYCNSLLYGAPMSTELKLQRAQNSFARVVLQQPKRSHAEPLLGTLHWLSVK
jgi:hypothetical protein